MKFFTDIARFELPEAFDDIEYFKEIFPYEKSIENCIKDAGSKMELDEIFGSFHGGTGTGFREEPRFFYRFSPKGLIIRYTLFHEIDKDIYFGGLDMTDFANFYVAVNKSEVIKIWKELKHRYRPFDDKTYKI